jgi:short-subunit dehydrogenase
MTAVKDKVIWITGASSGIGEALAIKLAAKGSRLVLSARNETALREVFGKCRLENSTGMVLPLDLEKSSAFEEAAKKVIQHFGKIDILINNGGVSQRSLALETPAELDRKIMEINFFGTLALTKAVLPYMISAGRGHIVVISSIAGKFGYFYRSAYAASKHALHGFFESLRVELMDRQIPVTIICPGKIKTDISMNALTKNGEAQKVMEKSHARAMDAGNCAEKIIRAIERDKEEVFIGGKELLAVWVKRFFPNLFTRIISRIKPD